jgi:hypothetical protein
MSETIRISDIKRLSCLINSVGVRFCIDGKVTLDDSKISYLINNDLLSKKDVELLFYEKRLSVENFKLAVDKF